jgi:hypothetical protein
VGNEKDHPPQEAYIPEALLKVLIELGWSPGADERGAEVWYPPAVTGPQTKPRHHDAIVNGIEAIIIDLLNMESSHMATSEAFPQNCPWG